MTDQGSDPIGMIGGVRADAPLFRKAPPAELREIVSLLNRASYHFADDSASEWNIAHAKIAEAAQLINKHRLGSGAINCLYEDHEQLFTKGDLFDAVLKDARGPQ